MADPDGGSGGEDRSGDVTATQKSALFWPARVRRAAWISGRVGRVPAAVRP